MYIWHYFNEYIINNIIDIDTIIVIHLSLYLTT